MSQHSGKPWWAVKRTESSPLLKIKRGHLQIIYVKKMKRMQTYLSDKIPPTPFRFDTQSWDGEAGTELRREPQGKMHITCGLFLSV